MNYLLKKNRKIEENELNNVNLNLESEKSILLKLIEELS